MHPSLESQNPQAVEAARLPVLEDLLAARDRIHPHIRQTPLLTSRHLGEMHSARVHLKAENLQRAGSFKIRGALNAMLCARSRGEISAAGVVSYSSGNHGQAVALAARILGLKATIVVPEDVRPIKEEAMKGYGATVVRCGLTSRDRHEEAERRAREIGATILRPYDHPDTIAGQGTAGLEILDALRDLDAVLVPVGGGGLVSGIAIAVKALRPGVRVVGVEPERGNDFQLSLAAGRKITIEPPDTIADGLRIVTPGDWTFLAATKYVDEIWTVSDAAILDAQRTVLLRAKLLVEPSGAAAAAAYVEQGASLEGSSVAVVLSGGNTTTRQIGDLP